MCLTYQEWCISLIRSAWWTQWQNLILTQITSFDLDQSRPSWVWSAPMDRIKPGCSENHADHTSYDQLHKIQITQVKQCNIMLTCKPSKLTEITPHNHSNAPVLRTGAPKITLDIQVIALIHLFHTLDISFVMVFNKNIHLGAIFFK